MHALGLRTGLDIRNQTLDFMQANFGRASAYYYEITRGIDKRPVRANRIQKSVGAESTFASDLTEFDAMVVELQPLIDKVWRHCESAGVRGRTSTLKVKFADFELISRSRSLPETIDDRDSLERTVADLLRKLMPLPKSVRLLGISLGTLRAPVCGAPQFALPM